MLSIMCAVSSSMAPFQHASCFALNTCNMWETGLMGQGTYCVGVGCMFWNVITLRVSP
jgi:hypothetical protein